MKLIGAAIKFYIIAVLFAYALAAITGAAVVSVTEPPSQPQGDTNVYRTH